MADPARKEEHSADPAHEGPAVIADLDKIEYWLSLLDRDAHGLDEQEMIDTQARVYAAIAARPIPEGPK